MLTACLSDLLHIYIYIVVNEISDWSIKLCIWISAIDNFYFGVLVLLFLIWFDF